MPITGAGVPAWRDVEAVVHNVDPMFRRILVSFLLTAAAIDARVVVRLAPPPVVVEQPVPAPGPAYIWTPGYYRWDGPWLCVGAWSVGDGDLARSAMGAAALGSPARRLDIRQRPLAVVSERHPGLSLRFRAHNHDDRHWLALWIHTRNLRFLEGLNLGGIRRR